VEHLFRALQVKSPWLTQGWRPPLRVITFKLSCSKYRVAVERQEFTDQKGKIIKSCSNTVPIKN
jgi:hypothetical protein